MNRDEAREFLNKIQGELEGLNQQVGRLAFELPLPESDKGQRKRVLGPRSSNTGAILVAVAQIAGQSDAVQQALGASSMEMEDVARQGCLLRGLIERAEEVERGAGQGAQILSGEIDGCVGALIEYANGAAVDPSRDGCERADVRTAFAPALLSQKEHAVGLSKAQKKAERKLSSATLRIEAARQARSTLDILNRFLSSAKKDS